MRLKSGETAFQTGPVQLSAGVQLMRSKSGETAFPDRACAAVSHGTAVRQNLHLCCHRDIVKRRARAAVRMFGCAMMAGAWQTLEHSQWVAVPFFEEPMCSICSHVRIVYHHVQDIVCNLRQ